MVNPSSIKPDVALAEALNGSIHVGDTPVKVYADWAKPTNGLPDDFISIYSNGDIEGFGLDNNFARGYIGVSLYSRMNDDGSVKSNRITKILEQFDTFIDKLIADKYYYRYPSDRFLTPTTPNVTSGYSITTLNLEWHTTNDFQTT